MIANNSMHYRMEKKKIKTKIVSVAKHKRINYNFSTFKDFPFFFILLRSTISIINNMEINIHLPILIIHHEIGLSNLKKKNEKNLSHVFSIQILENFTIAEGSEASVSSL